MKYPAICICALFFIIIISACRKDGEPIVEDKCVAGTGGSIDLAIIPQHHGDDVYATTVYIEFNTQASPGVLSNFDMVVVGDSAEEHVHVPNMKCGKYYIYCTGWDSIQVVRGGMPFTISETAAGDIDIYVPVSEL